MVRDTTEGKTNFLNIRFGPMARRWAAHLTKGREKYPDIAPGVPNWTLASGIDEFLRAKESAARHFEQWLAGERDEDHASAVFFNMNLAEYVLLKDDGIDPAAGVVTQSAPPVTNPAPVPPPGYRLTGEFRGPKTGERFVSFAFPDEQDPFLFTTQRGLVKHSEFGFNRWILERA